MAEPDNMNNMSDAQVPVPASENLDHDQDALMVEPDGEDDMVDAQVPLSQVENMDHDQDAPVPSIEQVHDPDSLFIPEDDPSAQIITPQQEPVAPIATPPLPTLPRPKVTGQSVSQKIRAMQTIRDHQKLVTSRQTSAYQTNSNLDDEAYLEAVRPGQSSSAAVPAINEDDLADKKAIKDFEAKKRYYDEQKRKKGTLLFKEDVDWLKITGAEEARKKKRSRDLARQREEKDGQSDLFPEFNFTPNIEEEVESDHDFDIQDSGARKRRRPMPTKEGKNPSMQDAELQSMRVALEAEGDASRKKQKGAVASAEEQASVPSGRGKASKGKGPAKQKSGPKKQTRTRGGRYSAKKQEVDHAYKQATSLFNSDVFQQQAGASAADQPTFRSRNKTDALKELIASVPIEVQKKARLDIDILLAATKEFDGKGQVKADGSGLWRVRGMSTSLKPYQVLGTAFMRRRENATEEPRGGLMADQMGLGKTLMMLANIVNGRPPKSDTGPKTTLLIASPALLTQWKNEIELHTDASKVNIKIMRYGAGTRPDSTNADQILAGHDVVLTTYHEIMQSYPKNEPPIECQTAEQKIAWWKLVFEKQRGPLHRMMFLRVVLDEAQAIKNHMSRTSIACRALMAHHKWALSGTPILNSLTELYPYFKFLDVPHTGSFKIFKNNYCDSKNQENTERLLVRLSQFMIRRTHADEMFGAPILKLPQADQSTHWCEFNSVERSIYDIVRVRFAKCINMWAQNGTLDKAYSNVLVMLLRLRQLTGHILMLQFVIRDLLEREDIEAIKTVVDKEAQTSSERGGHTIIAVRKQLDKVAADQKRKTADLEARKATAKKAARTRKDAARKAAKEQGVNYVSEDDDVNANAIGKDDELLEEEFDEPIDEDPADDLIQRFTAGGGFGKDFNFKPFLSSLKTGESWEKTKQKAKCAWCGKQPRAPQITSCGHLICSEPCLENVVVEMAEADDPDVFPACKACGATPTHIHPCEVDEDDTPDAPARGTRANKKKNKEKQRARLDREEVSGEWLDLAGEDVLPSAKTIAVKSQIMNWLNENPHVKIIVYTQFLAMIRILDAVFRKEGWVAEKYHGKMSLSARDKAISSFAENPDCKIMLASLRCGGLGLNLTMASKVIMIDPWWNSASEQQAFCRVFRIGQREETIMSRLCVRNTVDETLIDMQDRKDKEIAAIMEDDGKTMKKMDTRTLMRLFGNLEEDPDGKPFIMVDNPNPRGGFRADRDDEGYADDF